MQLSYDEALAQAAANHEAEEKQNSYLRHAIHKAGKLENATVLDSIKTRIKGDEGDVIGFILGSIRSTFFCFPPLVYFNS